MKIRRINVSSLSQILATCDENVIERFLDKTSGKLIEEYLNINSAYRAVPVSEGIPLVKENPELTNSLYMLMNREDSICREIDRAKAGQLPVNVDKRVFADYLVWVPDTIKYAAQLLGSDAKEFLVVGKEVLIFDKKIKTGMKVFGFRTPNNNTTGQWCRKAINPFDLEGAYILTKRLGLSFAKENIAHLRAMFPPSGIMFTANDPLSQYQDGDWDGDKSFDTNSRAVLELFHSSRETMKELGIDFNNVVRINKFEDIVVADSVTTNTSDLVEFDERD